MKKVTILKKVTIQESYHFLLFRFNGMKRNSKKFETSLVIRDFSFSMTEKNSLIFLELPNFVETQILSGNCKQVDVAFEIFNIPI